MAPQELIVQKDRTTAEAGEELFASSVTNFDPVDVAAQLLSGQADNAVGKVKPFLQSFESKHAEQPPPSWLGMVGRRETLNAASALMRKAARSEARILLYGESGTG